MRRGPHDGEIGACGAQARRFLAAKKPRFLTAGNNQVLCPVGVVVFRRYLVDLIAEEPDERRALVQVVSHLNRCEFPGKIVLTAFSGR